jgi:HK97 family phage major capsid protein
MTITRVVSIHKRNQWRTPMRVGMSERERALRDELADVSAELDDAKRNKAGMSEIQDLMARRDGLQASIVQCGNGDSDNSVWRGDVPKTETQEDRDFARYLRTGQASENLREYRDGQSTSGSAGGYMVPQGFWNHLQVALKSYGGVGNDFHLEVTDSGNPMPWPTIDPTTTLGAYVSENSQVSDTTYTFGQGLAYGWTITSGVIKASLQLVNDSAIEVQRFVAARVGENIGRKIAAEVINGAGSGSSNYTGIVTALTAYGSTGSNASGGVYDLGAATAVKTFAGTTTELAANVLAPATCVSMITAVDPAYYDRAKWYMNSAQAWGMRTIVDSNGRPLLNFDDGFADGAIGSLMGFPVVVDNNIANLTASTVGGPMFGNLDHAMLLRRVRNAGLMTLRERYADYLQIGWIGYVRGDSQPNDLRAVTVAKANST